MASIKVFPRPRRITSVGAGARSDTQPNIEVDRSVQAQGYELLVSPDSVQIRHSDEAGLRYAHHTLAQLRRQFGETIPGLAISDWPDTPNRAYMLDISRDRVPTMETFDWLVDVLAGCRINQLQLYTEHTFAFGDHELVWRDASPMTAAEMGELDRLCARQGIELVPCLNVFGHMGPWLVHDRYRTLAECPDGFHMPPAGVHHRPLTLEPTQANADFALDLVRELTATVSSSKVNICCDEAFELGLGRSRELVARRGKGEVFTDHLLRLVEPLIQEGHEVMFWGDMFRVDPGPIARLPRSGATALAWQYDPPSEPGIGFSAMAANPEVAEIFGIPADIHLGFESQTRQLADAGYPFWVAPGTASWNSLIGRWPYAQANLLDAVDVGLAAGANGLLLTDWGDNGHMQPLSVSALPIAYGAALSWCADQNRDVPEPAVVDRVFFGAESAGLADVLTTLGALSDQCGRMAVNGSALFYDLLERPTLPVSGSPTLAQLDAVLDVLEGAATDVERAAPACAQASQVKEELQAAVRLARHGAWRMARQAGFHDRSDDDLHADLAQAIEMQRSAWLGRSRSGGLKKSLKILEKTARAYDAIP